MIDLPLDFETYWSKDYRLDRLTTAEYVCDPRFEIIACSLRTPDGEDHWVSGDVNHVRSELLRLVPDWSAVRVVSHNARFEGAVLEWRLGIKPGAYLCTMVGSRPHILPFTRSVSLDAIGSFLGIGEKGDFISYKTQGKHRSDFTPAELADFGAYGKTDVKLTAGIGKHLTGILPQEEQDILDLTIKKFLRPRIRLARETLVARAKDIEASKVQLTGLLESKYGCTLKDIRSRPKFAALLKLHGAEPPVKMNKKGMATYAFAKDDEAFKALLGHELEAVRELVTAKLALSSTLEEARVKRLINLADIKDGWLPVPLVYYGAHPGRLSGDDEINLQNLPRVEIDKATGKLKKGHLRFALEAPEGYVILAADFSNIEARIVATLAGEINLREAFRQGRDIYAEFASEIYGRPITKERDPKERFVGKTCILGLGYGMGAVKLKLRLAQDGVHIGFPEAQRIIQLYRTKYRGIPLLWTSLSWLAMTQMMKKGALFPSELAGLIFAHERIILPNGMPLMYPGLKAQGGQLSFDSRFFGVEDSNWIWGGTFLENIAQALARIIATRAELRLVKKGLITSLQNHDELVFVVPAILADKVKQMVAKVMTETVDFLPDLPIAVEVKHGPTYGDAK